ncbi:MAG: hypothetical protein DRI71_00610 [Bacteroidetes bacterium]|nr:MAG: hypothetical protein DRI71_00610 [Bacteroidota bacterium]
MRAQESDSTQDADSLVRVEMYDGNEFRGVLVAIDEEKVVLKSNALGQITLYRKYIKKIEMVDSLEVKAAKPGYSEIHSTRYLFTSSAYGLEKGDSYYQNILVFYNQYNVGITDRFSMSFGILPFFLIAGSPTPVGVTPKYSFPVAKDKVNLSVGVLIGDIIGENNGIIALPHVTATFGSREKNVSIGMGYVFADGQLVPYPVINFSGLIKVSRRTFLMTENHIISDGSYIVGLSIVGAKSIISKAALSYGLGIPFTTDYASEIIAMPWIGLTIPFTNNN